MMVVALRKGGKFLGTSDSTSLNQNTFPEWALVRPKQLGGNGPISFEQFEKPRITKLRAHDQ